MTKREAAIKAQSMPTIRLSEIYKSREYYHYRLVNAAARELRRRRAEENHHWHLI